MRVERSFRVALLVCFASVVASGNAVLAHGDVDQSNLTNGGAQQVLAHMPIGQEFTPTRHDLIGVDIVFRGSTAAGSDTITVNIRRGYITSAVLASTSRVVEQCPFAPPYNCIEHFDFDGKVPLTPGDIYVIEIQATAPIHGWQGGPGNYPGGAPIIQGVRNPGLPDYGFQTYATTAELDACYGDLATCTDDLSACRTELEGRDSLLGECQTELARCGSDRTACATSLDGCQSEGQRLLRDLEESQNGVAEILRLLAVAPGKRTSRYSCSGTLCAGLKEAISRLLAPEGHNYR